MASLYRSMLCLKIWLHLEIKCEEQSSLLTSVNDHSSVQNLTQQNWKHNVSSQREALGTGDHATIGMLKELVQTSKISQLQDITNTSGNKKNHPASGPLTWQFCCQQPRRLTAKESPWDSSVSASAGEHLCVPWSWRSYIAKGRS